MSREEKSGGLCPKELLSEIEYLKAENSRLKHTVADQALDITTLKQWNEFMKKKWREEKLSSQNSSSESCRQSSTPKKDFVS